MADTTHLYTTVKNPLAFSRPYGYLGAHGRTLAAGASFSQIGDLVDSMLGRHSRWERRNTAALERDLLADKIEIIRTPRPILKDAVNDEIKALDLSGGILGVIDPSWGAFTDT